MSDLIPFTNDLIPFEDTDNLPAVIAVPDDEFGTGQRRGFPVLSFDGRVFSVARSGERERLFTLDANGKPTKAPATELEIIVLRASPGLSKTYYEKAYVQGSTERPDCYSNDGKAPAADAKSPQAKACATCVHNQWGARITAEGKKAKSCSDVKRVAIAPVGDPEDAMMLKLPAMSLANWDAYVSGLKRRGRNPTAVATKLSFDYSVTYPLLTFSAYAALGPATQAKVATMRESDVVLAIVDASMNTVADTLMSSESVEAAPVEAPAPVVEKPKTAAKKAAPAPKSPVETLEEVVAKATETAPVEIQVEGGDDILTELDGLDDLTFDD